MSKYALLNAVMGKSADFNDKIINGRSLKFYKSYDEDSKFTISQQLSSIPYVTNVYYGLGYIRVYVENI